jgi:large subunit ribosomal protein L20
MARAGTPVTRRNRHRKYIRRAKGYFLGRNNLFKIARETVERALCYAYRDRKVRKREFRKLWIIRIGAAARILGMPYNRFMNGLRKAGVDLDRKVLADLAVTDPAGFAKLVDMAKAKVA